MNCGRRGCRDGGSDIFAITVGVPFEFSDKTTVSSGCEFVKDGSGGRARILNLAKSSSSGSLS